MDDNIKRLTDAELVAGFRDERQKRHIPAVQPLHPTKDTIRDRIAVPDNLRYLFEEMKRRGITPPV